MQLTGGEVYSSDRTGTQRRASAQSSSRVVWLCPRHAPWGVAALSGGDRGCQQRDGTLSSRTALLDDRVVKSLQRNRPHLDEADARSLGHEGIRGRVRR